MVSHVFVMLYFTILRGRIKILLAYCMIIIYLRHIYCFTFFFKFFLPLFKYSTPEPS